MAYCLFRLYASSGPDPRRWERLRTEMLPKLQSIPAFIRFAAIETTDGRYGGFHVYETAAARDEAAHLFSEHRRTHGMTEPVSLEARGETGFSIVVDANYHTAYGSVRIYRAGSNFAEVNEAIQKEGEAAIRAIPGIHRYTTVRFDDGRIGTFAACADEHAAQALTQKARELRGRPGSLLAKALPTDPESIHGHIPVAFAKAPAAAHA